MRILFRTFLLVLLSFSFLSVSSQNKTVIDSLIAEVDNSTDQYKKLDLLKKIAVLYYQELDSNTFLYSNKAIELALELNDEPSAASNYRLMGFSETEINNNTEKAISYFKKAAKLDRINNNPCGQVKNHVGLAGIYGEMGEYNRAINVLNSGVALLDFNGMESTKERQRLYNIMGAVYVNSKDNIEAIKAFQKAEKFALQNKDTLKLGTISQNLGIAYSNQKDYNLAHEYTLKAYQYLKNTPRYADLYLIELNLAGSYSRLDSIEIAKKYAKQSLRHYSDKNMKRGMADAHASLGHILFKSGDIKVAEKHYLTSLKLSNTLGLKPRQSTIHQKLSKLYKKTGQFEKALHHFEKFKNLENIIFSIKEEKEIGKIKLKVESEKKQKELAQKDAKIQSLKLVEAKEEQKNKVIYISALLILIIALFIILSQRIKNKKNKEILKKEKELEQLKLSEERNKVSNLSKELDAFTQSLSEKNAFTEQLERKLEELGNTKLIGSENKEDTLSELYNLKILTEEDWIKFKELFNKVHKGTLPNIREKYQSLTQAEERLILLLKLNFTTSEISGITGTSINSVRKSRQRLRNKLQLDQEVVLEDFIAKM